MTRDSLYKKLLESMGSIERLPEETFSSKLIRESEERYKTLKTSSLKDFLKRENLL